MTQFVKVHGRRIPALMGAGPTEVYFSRGRKGKSESGTFRFWTISGEDEFGPWRLVARAKKSLSASVRFNRIVTREYKRHLRTVSQVRPSTAREVTHWINSHSTGPHNDAVYIEGPVTILGKKYKKIPKVTP